jgi:heptosyltransferase-2
MPIPVTKEILKRHQVYYYLNIIEALGGGPAQDPEPHIALRARERDWATGFLEKNGVRDKTLVGVSPGASYGPAKRWAPERFASALDRFTDHLGAVPVIFGGREDMEACSDVSGRLRAKHLNLAGTLELRQFMAVLNETALFLTNDSGPMHIAAALSVPTIAIFGSTDRELTGPVSKTSVTITKDLECSPCFKRECAFGHYKCLEAVSATEVFTTGAELLKRNLGWPA